MRKKHKTYAQWSRGVDLETKRKKFMEEVNEKIDSPIMPVGGEPKNTGFDLDKEMAERTDEDYIAGPVLLEGLAEKISKKGHKFIEFVLKGMTQRLRQDTMDCVTRAFINATNLIMTGAVRLGLISEIRIKQLREKGYLVIEDGQEVFRADFRYTAIKSGTTQRGNSMKAVIECIRKVGIIPYSMLPQELSMTWEEYHDKAKITKEMDEMAAWWVRNFTVNWERLNYKDFVRSVVENVIATYGYAWPNPDKNGVYPNVPGASKNHAFVDIGNPAYMIWDNYPDTFDGDYLKRLAPNYELGDGYHVIINEVPLPQPINTQSGQKKVVITKETQFINNTGIVIKLSPGEYSLAEDWKEVKPVEDKPEITVLDDNQTKYVLLKKTALINSKTGQKLILQPGTYFLTDDWVIEKYGATKWLSLLIEAIKKLLGYGR